MFRKLLLITGLLLAVSVVPALAGGDAYAPTNVQGAENEAGSITITGEGCPPNSEVTFVLHEGDTVDGDVVDSGSGTSDADGNFEMTTAPVPNGTYTAEVTCGGDTFILGVTVTDSPVGVTSPTTATDLPRTGSDSSIPLAQTGAGLIAIGGLIAYAAHKRRQRSAEGTAA